MAFAAASQSWRRSAVEPHFQPLRVQLHVRREQLPLGCLASAVAVTLEPPTQIVKQISANARAAILPAGVLARDRDETVDALVHVGCEARQIADAAEMGQVDGPGTKGHEPIDRGVQSFGIKVNRRRRREDELSRSRVELTIRNAKGIARENRFGLAVDDAV